jgi:proteasome lid subunit RPN8/RPN11
MILFEALSEKTMRDDALATFPAECCGFMFGDEEDGVRTIKVVTVVNNVKQGDKRSRFEISPGDYMRAERFAEDNNLQLLGVYHSHPNHTSVPSEHDRVSAQPYFSYVILSLINGKLASVQSWRLNDDDQFEEEKILQKQNIKIQ